MKRRTQNFFMLMAIAGSWLCLPLPALGQKREQEQKQKQAMIRSHPLYSYTLSGFGTGHQHLSFLSPLYSPTVTLTLHKGNLSHWRGLQRSSMGGLGLSASTNQALSYSADHYSSLAYPLPLQNILGPAARNTALHVGLGYWFDADFTFKMDNQNNPLYYNLNNMLCLTLHAQQRVGRVVILNELFVPLVGIYSASEFASSLPRFFMAENASIADAFHFGSFGVNQQVVNRLSFDVRYSFWRRIRTIRLQYEIMAQRFELNNNVKHEVFFTIRLGYLINRKESWYVHE